MNKFGEYAKRNIANLTLFAAITTSISAAFYIEYKNSNTTGYPLIGIKEIKKKKRDRVYY